MEPSRLKFWSVRAPKGNYGFITVLAVTAEEAIAVAQALGHKHHTTAKGTSAPVVGGWKGSVGLGVPVTLYHALFETSLETKPTCVILGQTRATRSHRAYQEEILEILH